jgi:hypothetical protein
MRRALCLLLAATLTSAVFAQAAAPVKPPRARTLTTTPPPPPPPPPDERLRDRRRVEPPADRVAEPSSEVDAPAPEVRAPAEVSQAERPKAGAPARIASELLVASTDVQEADAQRNWLAGQGAQLLRRRALTQLGWVLSVYRLKPGTSLAQLTAEFSQQWPASLPEINQRYTAFAGSGTDGPREYARALIGWPEDCPATPRIAMLDGPVQPGLPALRGRRVAVTAIAPADARPSYEHGTSLAVLLLGEGAPRGLLPGADLHVGVIMSQDDDGAFTTTELVVRGLDWVLGLTPAASALNLSFGGPHSAQVERALRQVLERMPVAAAAGNDGQRGVSWPAAYEGVIAVTALDANRRRWPRANTGEQVAIAAPGVEVWTIDGSGQGRYASGTSVATVFVTAALAASARGERTAWLRQHTDEAGAPGPDPEFGHGLLGMNGTCSRIRP